jgi:hypothetical protein
MKSLFAFGDQGGLFSRKPSPLDPPAKAFYINFFFSRPVYII